MNHESPKRIVVIGAGIVGASLAYHLSSKGTQVTVVEARGIASGVTGTSFAWINTSCAGPDPIAALRGGAIAAWRRLETQVPGLKMRWHGALSRDGRDCGFFRKNLTKLLITWKDPVFYQIYMCDDSI